MDDLRASSMGGGGPTVEVKSKFDAEFRPVNVFDKGFSAASTFLAIGFVESFREKPSSLNSAKSGTLWRKPS